MNNLYNREKCSIFVVTYNQKFMFKYIYIILLFLFYALDLLAVEPQSNSKIFNYDIISANKAEISFSPPEIELSNIYINDTLYTQIEAEGFMKSFAKGYPNLPSVTKLIAVPHGTELKINVKKSLLKKVFLNTTQVNNYIAAAKESQSKSEEVNTNNNKLNPVYFKNEYTGKQLTELVKVGQLNNLDIYELTYNPVSYNPVKGKIKTDKGLSATISTKGTSSAESSLIIDNVGAVKSSSYNLSNKYVIVSPPAYKDTLQEFIKWKKQTGFNVQELYIGQHISVNSKDSIKAYLKNIYESATGLGYVLLIGDVDQIPSWSSEGHVTDLYYGEFTGDYFPEAQYGRMSVNSAAELGNIIHKNIVVQKGLVDMAYQDTHIYVAGVDNSFAPVYCNGPVNYFLNYYANINNGITPKYYLYGAGSPIISNSEAAKPAILNNINSSAGIVYYTAHCVSSGWLNPSLTIGDINGTNINNKYPFYISNCCDSYMFNTTSFGEQVVKVKDKGAVAYVGTTDDSYWEEDYYWGVGSINKFVTNPTYEQSSMGVWDSWFHQHGESQTQWTQTAFDFMWFGNMAVQGTTSALKKYYWEVYNLSGDPSLIVRRKNYSKVPATYNSQLLVEQGNINVATIENAIVSLTVNNDIVATGKAGSTGIATLNFTPFNYVCSNCVELVVSHPDYLPHIDTLSIVPPNGSYIIVSDYSFENKNSEPITEANFSDTVYLNIELKNIGNATNSIAKLLLEQSNNFKYITDSIQVSSMNVLSTYYIENLPVIVNNNVADNSIPSVVTKVKFDNNKQSNTTIPLRVNAPAISAVLHTIDVIGGSGNGDGIIDTLEQVSIDIIVKNTGGAAINNVKLVLYDNNTEVLTVVSDTVNVNNLPSGSSDTVLYDIKASADFISGIESYVKYKIIAGEVGQYTFIGSVKIVMGKEPEINMKDTVIYVSSAKFYDSGGISADYGNREDYTATFVPINPAEGLIVEFYSVDIEPNGSSCYDKLYIYDGTTKSDKLISSFCSNGVPSVVLSQNNSGALTFRFISDMSTTRAGWEAYIYPANKYTVSVIVSDGIDILNNATVTLGNKTVTTDSKGVAVFESVLEVFTKQIVVNAGGYQSYKSQLNEFVSDTSLTVIMTPYPDVCLRVISNLVPVVNARVEYAGLVEYTDETGEATFEKLEPGSYNYTVSHYSIFDKTGTYSFISDQGPIDIEVKKRTAQCNFTITSGDSVLSSALVDIGGIIQETNQSGMVTFDSLEYGTLNITISKNDYVTINKTISVNNDTENFSFELIKGESLYSAVFNLTGVENIPLTNIFIHLNNKAIYSDTSIVTINEIATGYNLPFTIYANGYDTYYGTFDIIDRNISINITLSASLIDADDNTHIPYRVIYKNPVLQGESIVLSSLNKIEKANLYTASGELAGVYSLANGEFEISTKQLSIGVYVLELIFDEERFFERIVVE